MGMKPSNPIIDRFGGIRKTARALGHRNPTTVQGWYERGYIPVRQQGAVMEAAERAGVDIKPEEFFRVLDKRKDAA